MAGDASLEISNTFSLWDGSKTHQGTLAPFVGLRHRPEGRGKGDGAW